MAPLIPAPPRKRQRPRQPNLPKTPVPTTGTFASRQIQASRNRRAATVLFTPRPRHTPYIQNPRGQLPNQPSPTPQSRTTSSPAQPFFSSISGSSSDTEDDVTRVGLERLILEPSSSSGSQSPRAGHHSKQARVPPKVKGAEDVWTFFEEAGNERNCILCQ